ncbi:MAG: class I SAM-dependent methyltransferase [Planctomycetota bacterium]
MTAPTEPVVDLAPRRRFATEYRYVDRATKPRYVVEKYRDLLRGRVLDVGADGSQMRQALPAGCDYVGIGIGEPPTIPVDLERQGVPYAGRTFDCVLCLDVLEHVDRPHELFDHLCRVSRGHVIVSLPNCWGAFWTMLRHGPYRPDRATKFYGLPTSPPEDRHKWFFHPGEAEAFVRERARRLGAAVLQVDCEGDEHQEHWQRELTALQDAGLVHAGLDPRALFAGALWAVLDVRGAG